MLKRLISCLIAAFAALILTASLGAATSVAITGTVTGAAALSVTSGSTATFSSALDGTDNSATFSIPLTVTDARGTDAGWNLTVASTAFTDGAGHSLPAATVTGATSSCLSTCSTVTNTVTYPITTSVTGIKFFSTTSARGKFTVTPAFAVLVAATAFAGTYTSTYTIAAVSGP